MKVSRKDWNCYFGHRCYEKDACSLWNVGVSCVKPYLRCSWWLINAFYACNCVKVTTLQRQSTPDYFFNLFVIQKETPSDQQLHLAALQGNVEQLKRVLETGKVHVDCKDKVRRPLINATPVQLYCRLHYSTAALLLVGLLEYRLSV